MRLCFNFQQSHAWRILGTLLENKKSSVSKQDKAYWIVFSGVTKTLRKPTHHLNFQMLKWKIDYLMF